MQYIYSWSTKKVAAGFEGRATRMEHKQHGKVEVVSSKLFSTRTKAKTWAQRQTRINKRSA